MNLIKKLKWAAFLLVALIGCTEIVLHEKKVTPNPKINYTQILTHWANGLHKGIQHGYHVMEVRKPATNKDTLVFMVRVYYHVDADAFIEYHVVAIDSVGKIVLSENITPPEYINPEYEEDAEDKLRHEV
jgi:hypothetical protein